MKSSKEEVKTTTLAFMVLHNICIDRGETLSKQLDLTLDSVTNQRRDRNQVRELLQMTSCERNRDSSKQANAMRDALADKRCIEKKNQGGLLDLLATTWLFFCDDLKAAVHQTIDCALHKTE